jgi:hypothetical protein
MKITDENDTTKGCDIIRKKYIEIMTQRLIFYQYHLHMCSIIF